MSCATRLERVGALVDLTLHPDWRRDNHVGLDPSFPCHDVRLFASGADWTAKRSICDVLSDGDRVSLRPREPQFALVALRVLRHYQAGRRPASIATLTDRMCVTPDAFTAAVDELKDAARAAVLEHRLTVGAVVEGVSYDPQPGLWPITDRDAGARNQLAVIRGDGDTFTVQLTGHPDAGQTGNALRSYLHGRTRMNGTVGLAELLDSLCMTEPEYRQLAAGL